MMTLYICVVVIRNIVLKQFTSFSSLWTKNNGVESHLQTIYPGHGTNVMLDNVDSSFNNEIAVRVISYLS